MAEELQHLIDRIQKEAVDTADAKSDQIISQAKEKAAGIVKNAEQQAKSYMEKAKQDAVAYTARSTKTLEQAARDLLISVGQGVENILADLVSDSVGEALKPVVIEQMLAKMAEAYTAKGGNESRIDLLVSPKDQKELVQFFAEQYRQKLGHGLQLHVDNDIFKGFKVSFVDDHVYHDFTREAIAESLTNFLRPQLAEIVNRVAQEESQTDKD